MLLLAGAYVSFFVFRIDFRNLLCRALYCAHLCSLFIILFNTFVDLIIHYSSYYHSPLYCGTRDISSCVPEEPDISDFRMLISIFFTFLKLGDQRKGSKKNHVYPDVLCGFPFQKKKSVSNSV